MHPVIVQVQPFSETSSSQSLIPPSFKGHTESSLEDHRFDLPNNQNLPQFAGNSSSTTHVSPTPVPKPAPSRPVVSGKENIRPEIRQTPPEMHPQSNFHHRRPTAPTQAMFPSSYPHMFFDSFHHNPANPLFSQDYSRPFTYHTNDFNENMKASGYASNFNGDFRPVTSMTRSTLSHPLNSMATSNTTTGEASNHGLGFEM